jgi:hypothetical protein
MELTEKQLDKALESIIDGSDPLSFQNPGSRDLTVESLMERLEPLQNEAVPTSVREKLEKAEGYAQEYTQGHISEERAIREISEMIGDPEVVEAIARANAHESEFVAISIVVYLKLLCNQETTVFC